MLCGKAGRVAHVVPAAHPFVAGLWGGLAGARAEPRDAGYECTFVPCRRLCSAAAWLRALLRESDDCPLRLERLVRPPGSSSRRPFGSGTIEFDASIFGGGAVLRDSEGQALEYFSVVWHGDEAKHLRVVPRDPRFQSFWEFATLLLSLCLWGTGLRSIRCLSSAITSELAPMPWPWPVSWLGDKHGEDG